MNPPSNQQQPPALIARTEDGSLNACAQTKHAFTKRVAYNGGVVGEVTLSIFRSTDVTHRGGVVLRITSTCPSNDAFLAHAKVIDGGIEVHMAGAAEGDALLDALRQGIAEMKLHQTLRVDPSAS